MMLSQIDLEVFDNGSVTTPVESADFKRGYEAGQTDARASDAAMLTQATEAISARLADMAFGYAEARILLLERIHPLLTQVAEAILPQIAQDSFAAHLVDVIMANFEDTAAQPVQISVNSAVVDSLNATLTDASTNFFFVPDATLSQGQALLKNPDTHIMIDLPALTLALQTALNGLEPHERKHSHG